MAFSVEQDGATLVRVRYKNFNEIATCKKYFYRYVDVIGKALPIATHESLTPFLRGFLKVATGRNLDAELENSGKTLLSFFFEAIVAAQDVFIRGDLEHAQRIYAELVRQLFSGDYKLKKVKNLKI